MLTQLPIVQKSKTEQELPKRLAPKILSDEPSRKKFLRLQPDPIWMVSRMDNEDPILHTP
jgi:hypothetical protein